MACIRRHGRQKRSRRFNGVPSKVEPGKQRCHSERPGRRRNIQGAAHCGECGWTMRALDGNSEIRPPRPQRTADQFCQAFQRLRNNRRNEQRPDANTTVETLSSSSESEDNGSHRHLDGNNQHITRLTEQRRHFAQHGPARSEHDGRRVPTCICTGCPDSSLSLSSFALFLSSSPAAISSQRRAQKTTGMDLRRHSMTLSKTGMEHKLNRR